MKKKIMTLLMAVAVMATILPCKVEAAGTQTVYLLDSYTYEDPSDDTKEEGTFTYTKGGFLAKSEASGMSGAASSYYDTEYKYDKSNRISQTTFDARLTTPSTTKLYYKGNQCVKAVQQGEDWEGNPYSNTCKYTYDKKGRVTAIQYGSGSDKRTFKYNSKGLVASRQYGSIIENFTYDKNGYIVKYASGSSYSENYKLTYKDGRIASCKEGSGATKFKYKKYTVNKKDAATIKKQQKALIMSIYSGQDTLNRPDIY